MNAREIWRVATTEMWWVPTYREMVVPAVCGVAALYMVAVAAVTLSFTITLIGWLFGVFGLTWMVGGIRAKAQRRRHQRA